MDRFKHAETSVLVVMVMVDEQKLFFLAVDFGNESSLDPLIIFVARAAKSQKLLVRASKNGAGDLGRFQWLEH